MPESESTPARVLVVEDDAGAAQSQEALLQQGGFRTASCRSGAEALARAQTEPFDLVLLDIDLPGEPGALALTRELKKAPHLAWMPVMFVAGQISAEVVAKVYEAGGDEFIAHPFKPDELIVRAKVLSRKGREERWLVERARKLAEKIAERDDELDDLRRFAQDIVSSLPSAIMVLDAQKQILFVNAPLLQWLGLERREVINKNLVEFTRDGLTGDPLAEAIAGATGSGQPRRLRRVTGLFASRPDRVSDLTVAAIDYAGERQVLVVIEDVTEQARAEAAVARERAKLHDIVNALNAALCLVDRERAVIWKNRTFDLWFGDAFGQPGLQAFLDRIPKGQGWWQSVFQKGQVHHQTWSVFTVHGQRRFFANIIAPIQAEDGEPISQALILTQDVTEQETRVEQLSLLRELSQFLQQTLDGERLNHVILLCVTAGHALGFNRAFLFKRNHQNSRLEARMAVGPTSREEAFRIWAEISSHGRTLHELVEELDRYPSRETPLFAMVRQLSYAMDDPSEIVVRTALEKKPQVLTAPAHDERVTDHFRRVFGHAEFVSVPMVAKGSVVGVLLADNLYSGRAITEDHVKLLSLFGAQAALAIENAETYAELRKSMSELRSAQEKIVHAEKLAAVGKMAAHVAHEIRNPLATIGGFARAVLKRPENVERVQRNVGIISEEASRLENMLKGVMDFARPTSPVFKLGDLNAVVQKAFRAHAEPLGQKKIQAELDLDSSLPEVGFDEGQILQVLHNLIRNAADSMPNGGAFLLKTGREGEMATIMVQDTGCGIPPEVRDRMFSPFVTTKPDGTGLGLAVTKKIVDDHLGVIRCESTPGEGTTFQIGLPLRQPASGTWLREAPPAGTPAPPLGEVRGVPSTGD
ncbi:MAG: ATP-binding protein [Planctomycetota bacterium]|nr:ATP-binding protein [Planctomycetota bacterium]